MPFTTLQDHFAAGLTFEQAKQHAGYGACSCTIAVLLAKYWNLLEMERAVELAAGYFDRLEGLT
jgi:hypothetical protein